MTPIVRAVVEEHRAGPLMISQRNSDALLGISRRMHLELCLRSDFTPRVLRVGKLRLVDAAEYRTWLRSVSSKRRPVTSHDPDDDASAVLAELGLREKRGPVKDPDAHVATNAKRPTRLR